MSNPGSSDAGDKGQGRDGKELRLATDTGPRLGRASIHALLGLVFIL